MIDSGVAYFTNGLCIPTGGLDGVSYFTLGLIIPGASAAPQGGGISTDVRERREFVQQAQEEADFLLMVLLAVTAIDDE